MTAKYSLRNIGKAFVNTGLAAIVAGSVLAGSILQSGCATPNCIKERRYLGAQGKLNSGTYLEFTANEKEAVAKAGISVNFNNLKELREGAASAGTAFVYGFVRPAYREFYSSNKPDQYEFNGLAPFNSFGYQDGRKAETTGEWLRNLFIIYGVSQLGKNGKGSGFESNTEGPTTTTTTTTDDRTHPTIPITTTTTIPPVNPPTGPQGGDTGGSPVGHRLFNYY